MGPQNSGHCRQVVAIRRWSLAQVWLYILRVLILTIKCRISTVFHRFGQAKFADGGSILGSSQFTQLPQLPQNWLKNNHFALVIQIRDILCRKKLLQWPIKGGFKCLYTCTTQNYSFNTNSRNFNDTAQTHRHYVRMK